MKKKIIAIAIAASISSPASAGLFDKVTGTLKDVGNQLEQSGIVTINSSNSNPTTDSVSDSPRNAPTVTVSDDGFCSTEQFEFEIKGISLGMNADEMHAYLTETGAVLVDNDHIPVDWTKQFGLLGKRTMTWSGANSTLTVGGHPIKRVTLRQEIERNLSDPRSTDVAQYECLTNIQIVTSAPMESKTSIDSAMKSKYGRHGTRYVGEYRVQYRQNSGSAYIEKFNTGVTKFRDTGSQVVSFNFNLMSNLSKKLEVVVNGEDF